MTDTPRPGTTPHDTGTVPDFDIVPGRVGTERKRAEETSDVVELLRLANRALSINQDKIPLARYSAICGRARERLRGSELRQQPGRDREKPIGGLKSRSTKQQKPPPRIKSVQERLEH